jgi:superfamily II DNA or RNA helicase
MALWPHQQRGIAEVLAAIGQDERRLCLCSPTGGGKTEIMLQLARHYLDRGEKVVLYTNRKFLLEQTSEALLEARLYHGVQAPGWADERDHRFQVASVQTVHSRAMRKRSWRLHDADLVLVDEGHLQNNPTARAILKAHWERGAAYVLFTATPLGLADVCERLIVAGTNSELRTCGAIVLAVHYGPDEPDLKAFHKLREGQDPSKRQQRAALMTPGIFGRVWAAFEQLNPQRKPAVLFGPGVAESLWFAEQFCAQGVPAAHIDGDDVWLEGKLRRSDRGAREAVREGSKAGEIKVVCNRYVLREGVNWPWIEHMILAFVAGSLQTYLQVGGRGLRAHPGKTHLTVQDHGGAWWRHGSLNADRDWQLSYTSQILAGLRADALRGRKLPQPFRCPSCGRIWTSGQRCQPVHGGCGYELPPKAKRSRPVVAADGTLKEMHGDVYRPRRIHRDPSGPKLWERMYYRSRTEKGARTFRAAATLFAQENDWAWPDPTWPLMPREPLDWFLLVKDVPMERLTPKAASR